jgi:Flp pilus assembly pilin Flp
MRATLSYTLLRVLIFLAVALILALFGVHGLTLIVVALLISAIISLPLLSRFRDRMSTSLTNLFGKFGAKLDEGTRGEDVD